MYRFFTDSKCYQSSKVIILSISKIKLENYLYKEYLKTLKSIKDVSVGKNSSIKLSFKNYRDKKLST